jgi:hypothetical protein
MPWLPKIQCIESMILMPKPNKQESKEEWLERCIPVQIREGKDRDQAVAICMSQWNQRNDRRKK